MHISLQKLAAFLNFTYTTFFPSKYFFNYHTGKPLEVILSRTQPHLISACWIFKWVFSFCK